MAPRERLSVGNDETEAIARIKEVVDKDARCFSAQEITSVFGYKVNVQKLALAQDVADEPTDEMDIEADVGQAPIM